MQYLLIEFDLSGAEWVVVAYLSGDPKMLEVVASGKSPHVVTGRLISGAPEDFIIQEHELLGSETNPDKIAAARMTLDVPKGIFLPRSMSIRQAGKKSNHGLNYGMKYRRAALEWEVPEKEAEPIVAAYTEQAYIEIPRWWASIVSELGQNDRCLMNCFGRKVRLIGEWGHELFNAAYSFKPQSTVVDVQNQAIVLAYKDETEAFRLMKLGAQVHDSALVQMPVPHSDRDLGLLVEFLQRMGLDYMRPELEYGGRHFRLSSDVKIGHNWGSMQKVKLSVKPDEMAASLQDALSALSALDRDRQGVPAEFLAAGKEPPLQPPADAPAPPFG